MIHALTRPARKAGFAWEPGFAEEIAQAVMDQASPLPVLQLAASWVWERRAPGASVLARSLLAAEGEVLRIGDLLGQYADAKLRAASWSEGDRELVKRMLPTLVTAEATPRVVPIDEVLARCPHGAAERGAVLLRHLTDFRLLTSLRDERARECLTPVHATLIASWSLMREALEGSAELEAFRRRLERDAHDWDASARDPAKLWPAAASRDFLRWAAQLDEVRLSPAEVAFRDAVSRSDRRARRLRWALAAGLFAIAAGGAWAGVSFADKADEAERSRREAEAQQAVAERQTGLAIAHRREADELIDYMLGDLRERLLPLGQVKVLRAVAEKAKDYLDRRDGGRSDTSEDATRRAAVLRHLGAVFREEGDTASAEEVLREALAIAEHQTRARPADVELERAHAASLVALGGVEIARGDPAGGLGRYRSALVIYDRLAAAAPSDARAQRDLAVIQDRLGDLLGSLGEHEAALVARRAALSITQRLASAEPESATAQRDLAVSHNKVGSTLAERGDLAGARAVREASLRIVEALAVRDPGNAMAQRDLSIGHASLGDLLAKAGELERALAAYRASLAIDVRLGAADPASANAQRDLSISHNKVGDVLFAQGDTAGARREYEAALEIAKRLADADPESAHVRRDLAQSWSRVGSARVAGGDVAAGLEALESAVAVSEQLADELATSQAKVELARALGILGEALAKQGDAGPARTRIARARSLLAPILGEPSAPSAWRDLDAWLVGLGGP
jgi:tetratricopeptide (TPR) repeat protein